MVPSAPSIRAWRFGPFRLSVADRILERNGERVQLTPKVIDTLFVLVENRNQVTTKDALMKSVWPDVTVVESGLTRNISALRKALEPEGNEESYIETIPRRGYRFIAEVHCEYDGELTSADGPPSFSAEAVPAANASPNRRALIWPALLTGAVLATAGSLFLFSRPVNRPVEPHVRIGEHLLYKLAPEETRKAADYFVRAISDTPRSAAAHAGLSIALLWMSALGVTSFTEVADQAEAAARRSLELDPNLAVARYAVASIEFARHWRLDVADREFRLALELDPSSVQSRFGYAQLKIATGELNAALALTEEALRLDPASPLIGTRYCQTLYFARQFRRAEAECRNVIDREPRYALAHYYLGLSLAMQGQTTAARRILQRSGLMPGVIQADEAWITLLEGDRKPAEEALAYRRELIRQGKLSPSATLLLATVLEHREEAHAALEHAVQSRAVELMTVRVDPRLAVLRQDRRFAALLKRVGL